MFRHLYPNTMDARQFGAVFSDGRNLTMCDRMGVCRDTDNGGQNRELRSFGPLCAGNMDPAGRPDMPLIRHAAKVPNVCRLRWILIGTEDYWSLMERHTPVGCAKPCNRLLLSVTRTIRVESGILFGFRTRLVKQ